MRVAMVAYAFYDGNSRIQQYAKALAYRGDSVDILCLYLKGHPRFERIDGVNIYGMQSRGMLENGRFGYALRVLQFLLNAAVRLARMHLQRRYDVIHVHSVPDFLVLAAVVPKLLGAKLILDIHDILPEFYVARFAGRGSSFLFKLLVIVEKMSIAFSDQVIVANPIWHDRLIGRSVNAHKIVTIENHPDPGIFAVRPKERADGKFVLIYPGSMSWHQGLDIAIRAFRMIEKEIPEAEFHIYGDGPERGNLERLVYQNGLQAKVIFRNFLPTMEIARIMCNADIAVVPKRSKSVFGTEAASTKVLEFMSVGVPVVVSRTRIDGFYYTDSLVKFYERDDPDELAKAILLLYRDPSLRAQLAANAAVYAREQSWDRKKESYLALLD